MCVCMDLYMHFCVCVVCVMCVCVHGFIYALLCVCVMCVMCMCDIFVMCEWMHLYMGSVSV